MTGDPADQLASPPLPSPAEPTADPPLRGVRVLDLTRMLPGGYASMLLADLGADVVKVEDRQGGDPTRYLPPLATTGQSGGHLALDRGKRSITADLKHPDGRALVADLSVGSDVVLESFRPGVLDRLGLGWAALSARNPRLVLVSITAYGQQGPYSGRPAHDLNVQALSGALALGRGPGPGDGSGEAGPATPYLQVGDLSAGLQAVVATLAALRVRDATGAGQHCDVAMLDGVASLLTLAAGAAGVSGEAPSPVEHLTGALACYGTYRCADGRYLAVGALEPKFFARICALIGREDLIDLQYVPDRQGEVRAALAAVFLGDTREGWTRLLAAEDTCVTPVLDVSEFFADEQARARGLVEDVALADGSTFTRVGAVPRLPGSPAAAGPQAPGLGADLEAVAERVGLGAAEVRRLRDAGAV